MSLRAISHDILKQIRIILPKKAGFPDFCVILQRISYILLWSSAAVYFNSFQTSHSLSLSQAFSNTFVHHPMGNTWGTVFSIQSRLDSFCEHCKKTKFGATDGKIGCGMLNLNNILFYSRLASWRREGIFSDISFCRPFTLLLC